MKLTKIRPHFQLIQKVLIQKVEFLIYQALKRLTPQFVKFAKVMCPQHITKAKANREERREKQEKSIGLVVMSANAGITPYV